MSLAREYRSGPLGAVGARVTVSEEGITESLGPFHRTIPWHDMRDLRVARPKGLLPGVTIIVTRGNGRETPLMSLALDVLPASSAAHARLRAIVGELEMQRP